MMSPEKIAEFKKLFEKERMQILAHQAKVAYEFQVPQEELSDEMDLTSTELEQNMRIRLQNRQMLYLKKIEQALAMIKEGTYGECKDCGDTIELKRLEARPTSTLCMECKEEQEHKESLHADGRAHKSIGQKLRLKLA